MRLTLWRLLALGSGDTKV